MSVPGAGMPGRSGTFRVMMTAMAGVLLATTVSAREGDLSQPHSSQQPVHAAAQIELKGPSWTECEQATSDYERHDLGCPTDEAPTLHSDADRSHRD